MTKLSLLLKLMEDENVESRGELFRHSDLKLLPDLSNNIKCGNSLIGSDYFRDKNLSLFGDEYMRKINPFDWEKEFPDILKNGGFDVIIGNPPYISFQNKENTNINYFVNKYKSAVGKFDIYVLFNEKSLELINNDGLIGFIQPHKFINADFGKGIRNLIVSNKYLYKLINFGDNDVFTNATTYSCLVFYSKKSNKSFLYFEFPHMPSKEIEKNLKTIKNNDYIRISYENIKGDFWILKDYTHYEIFNKIQSSNFFLKDIANITQGVIPGNDDIYYLKILDEFETTYLCTSNKYMNNFEIEKDIIRPIIKGNNVNRYYKSEETDYIIYPYKIINDKQIIISIEELKNSYPKTYEYLSNFKKFLTELRVRYKTNPKHWYGFHRPRNMKLLEQKKIITSHAAKKPSFSLVEEKFYYNQNIYGITLKGSNYNLKYLLALLNSNICNFFIRNSSTVIKGGFYLYKTDYLLPFPLPKLDLNNNKEKQIYNKIVLLVEQMLEEQKKFHSAKTENDKKMYQKKIELIDKQIDNLVYELYSLTDKEIKIVESLFVNI